jgi:hypothetical protein
MTNDHMIPIGILKKKKSDLNERENHQKRFCSDKILGELEFLWRKLRNRLFLNENFRIQ